MPETKELTQLTIFIEENLRAGRAKGIQFVDPRKLCQRVYSKQNHVIFGKRGTGKTRLISAIEESPDFLTVYVNLEDGKDRTLEENAREISRSFFAQLQERLNRERPWYDFKAGFLKRKLSHLQTLLTERMSPVRVRKQFQQLSKSTADFKDLINQVSKKLGNKSIYLALDDFYFVPRKQQAELIDFFHRLTKDSALFLKVATIRERSELNRAVDNGHIGMEIGHDAQAVDMEYSLEKFEELEGFLRELLVTAGKDAGVQADPTTYFKEEGFRQLCVASEGVPREFLSLFVRTAHKNQFVPGPCIGRDEILEQMDPERIVELPKLEKSARLPRKNIFQRFFDFLVSLFTKRSHPQDKEAEEESFQEPPNRREKATETPPAQPSSEGGK